MNACRSRPRTLEEVINGDAFGQGAARPSGRAPEDVTVGEASRSSLILAYSLGFWAACPGMGNL